MQELIAKLKDENLTVKEQKQILKKIGDKVDGIWRFIMKTAKLDLDWWAFRNDVPYGHGDGSSGGDFDPVKDGEFIKIIGKHDCHHNKAFKYNDGFPTRFLWEDFQTEVINHLKEIEQQETKLKEQKKTAKEKKQELVASIKSKLTPEENILFNKFFNY